MVRKRPLRATRRRAPVPTTEQQPEQEESSQPRRRRARGATKRKYVEVEEDESSLSESSRDEEEEPQEKPARKARGAATKKRKGNKTTTNRRGPASARTCPHCNKVFSIKEGLQYHLDHKVCQQKNQGKKQTATLKGGKKQGGGPRKCPRCNKKFSVLAGLAYHLNHNVCQKDTKAGSSSSTSDSVLPGARFVTPYGVVQVVADNRQGQAVVTAAEKPSAKQRNVASAAKSKRDAKRKKHMMNLAIRMRMRRARLMRLYNNQGINMTQADVWNAYFGKDPTKLTDEDRKNFVPQGKNKDSNDSSSVPDTSPLDRIVECILIPDERQKIYDLDDYEPLNSWDAAKASVLRAQKEATAAAAKPASDESSSSVSPYCGMRLFLKRQLLMQPYSPDMRVFVCVDCNREFASREGFSYHVRSQVCTRKAKAREEQARQEREDVQARSERSLSRSERSLNRNKERGKQRSKRRLDQCAMYPQVMLALGYRLLPKTHENSTAFSVGATTEDENPEEAMDTGPDLVDPQIVLDELQAELQKAETALSKTKPLPTKRRKKKKIKPKQRKKVVAVVDRKPPLPIIDTRVLVDEVDVGRYPSMKRYNGEHSDTCVNCKEGGTMYCCDFCKNAEHFECIRAKLTVKEPEPKDDFMCHKCIQYILARRARAEKRRQVKQSAVLFSPETGQTASATAETTSSEMNEENEYERVAKIGREMNELVELLQDARDRLQIAAETTTVNDIRRSMLDPC